MYGAFCSRGGGGGGWVGTHMRSFTQPHPSRKLLRNRELRDVSDVTDRWIWLFIVQCTSCRPVITIYCQPTVTILHGKKPELCNSLRKDSFWYHRSTTMAWNFRDQFCLQISQTTLKYHRMFFIVLKLTLWHLLVPFVAAMMGLQSLWPLWHLKGKNWNHHKKEKHITIRKFQQKELLL